MRRLRQLGMTPEVMMVLSPAQLAAEDQLKAAIRDFTGYVPLEEDEEETEDDSESDDEEEEEEAPKKKKKKTGK